MNRKKHQKVPPLMRKPKPVRIYLGRELVLRGTCDAINVAAHLEPAIIERGVALPREGTHDSGFRTVTLYVRDVEVKR